MLYLVQPEYQKINKFKFLERCAVKGRKQAGITKYEIVDTALRQGLSTGRWKEGEKLPSESELMQQFGVSRTLVRNVLAGMIHDGLIESYHGKGSFVLPRKIHIHAPYQKRLREQLEQRGHDARIETIEFGEISAPPSLAYMLRMTVGTPVYVYAQRRFVDQRPFSVSTSYLPKKLFPHLESFDLQEIPLSKIMEQHYGYKGVSANEFLEAVFATKEVASYLEVEEGYALLQLEQLNYSEDDIPFEMNRILFRSDRVRLHFDYNR